MVGKFIGTIEVKAGTMQRSFETASWYETIEFEAQEVELYATSEWISYRIDGVVTYEFFPSSFAGNMTGGGPMGPVDNRPTTEVVQLRNYALAAAMTANPEDYRHVHLDHAEITHRTHDHPEFCSGYTTDYSIREGISYPIIPCDCDYHEDAHYNRIKETWEHKGHTLHPKGYKGGVRITKDHYRIVATEDAEVAA